MQGLLNEFKGTFTVNLPSQKAVLDEMTSEQEAITTRLEEVRAHMQATEEAAENYRVELLLSEERFEKLPVLDRCQAWLEDQNTTFSAGEYVALCSASFGTMLAFQAPYGQPRSGWSCVGCVLARRLTHCLEPPATARAYRRSLGCWRHSTPTTPTWTHSKRP